MTDFAPPTDIHDEVMAFLLSSPTPQAIIEFRVSNAAQQRLRYLLDANRNRTLSPEEADELEIASNVRTF